MCGIVGASAQNNIIPILIEGLKRLEYRGYDSCGIALQTAGMLKRSRTTERVGDLERQLMESPLHGATGIGHTRWATHGAPASHNAHPHISRERIALVHNGIIENHEALKAELADAGYGFESETDTEVIAHLIDSLYRGDLYEAVRESISRLKGAYAIAVISRDEPGRMIGARLGSPLVLGIGDSAHYLASDAMALAGVTDRIIYLEDGDITDLSPHGFSVSDAAGHRVERDIKRVTIETGGTDLGPYRHFMQKEIFEQPRAVADTLEGVVAITPELFGERAAEVFAGTDSVLVLACGTSFYAGLVAKYWIEAVARIPVQVEIASEYRYRDSVPDPRTLSVVVSQSGETADTLAALKHAKSQGMKHSLAICNVGTSAMVRECELSYVTRAGVEVGVASTKAFTTQLVSLFLLALTLAKCKGRLPAEQEADHIKAMRHLPTAISAVLALEPQVIAWADTFAHKEHALFLGRGLHYPIALEGALKLKEISYIHAEGYPAGELKHGPLALVTGDMPVVTIAPNDALIEKLKSNMQEVRARGGKLYVFADADSHVSTGEGMRVIRLPEHYGLLSPILHVVTLQLLAYHTALARGTDVDKPRNLAKSVTVE
ncbi:MAG: glmS [Paucimonas sp.]|nr:glmS [Paucimonas sp.]